MEEKLQTIPTEKDFNLSKVKLLPKGGIQAEYQVTQVVGGEPSVLDRNETCTRDVHPDMSKMFERCFYVNKLDVSSFDTSKVTTMEDMFVYFSDEYGYDTLDLKNFDVSLAPIGV